MGSKSLPSMATEASVGHVGGPSPSGGRSQALILGLGPVLNELLCPLPLPQPCPPRCLPLVPGEGGGYLNTSGVATVLSAQRAGISLSAPTSSQTRESTCICHLVKHLSS